MPLLGETQQIRWMKRRHHPDIIVPLPAPPHPGQGFLGAQQGLGRDPPQRNDHQGPDSLDLFLQEGQAGGDLIGLRVPVPRRPALQNIGDVDLSPAQPQFAEQVVEELARRAHKGDPLRIFLRPRGLTHEHQPGVAGALAEDQVGAAGVKLAPAAVAHLSPDFL